MNYNELRKNSKRLTEILKEQADKDSNSDSYGNENFWKLTVDQAGNGAALIRFIPCPDDDGIPYAKYYSHSFKGPTGMWYIEKSLTTFNETDPVGEYNAELWNSGTPEGKKQAREQRRTLNYVANILVLNDPGNPANNGQVFKFRFGKKIWEKINDKLHPDFGEESVNVFDFDEGANFRLKARDVKGSEPGTSYRSYDLSAFDSSSQLFDGNDEKLSAVFEKTFSLVEYKDRAYYKSYDELKKYLSTVMGWNRRESYRPEPAQSPGSNTVEREVSVSDYNDGYKEPPKSNDSDDITKYAKYTDNATDDFDDDDIPF